MKLFQTMILTLAVVLVGGLAPVKGYAETLTINAVALEVNGTKIWLPSTIVAKKGDLVKIHAVSKIPGQNNVHGFAIDQFKVKSLATDKVTDIEFVADKVGIFPLYCHLHPAHIGGQILVTE